eukprot:gene10510-4333_t
MLTRTTLLVALLGQSSVYVGSCEACGAGMYQTADKHRSACIWHVTPNCRWTGCRDHNDGCNSNEIATGNSHHWNGPGGGFCFLGWEDHYECCVRPTCPNGQFESKGTAYTNRKCSLLSNCNPGTHVTVQHTANSNRQCGGCSSGTFTDSPNLNSCKAHQSCGKGLICGTNADCTEYQYEAEPPTPTTGRQCGQITLCTLGEYVTADPTPTSDRACNDCDGEVEFSGKMNSESCTPLDTCGKGEYVGAPGSRTKQLTCTACPGGQSQSLSGRRPESCFQQPRCAKGERLANADATRQGFCDMCGAGQYIEEDDHRSANCVQQPFCNENEYLAGAGLSSRGTCTECPPGTEVLDRNHRASECTLIVYDLNSTDAGEVEAGFDPDATPPPGWVDTGAEGGNGNGNTGGGGSNGEGIPTTTTITATVPSGGDSEASAAVSDADDEAAGGSLSTGVLVLIILVTILFVAVAVMLFVWQKRNSKGKPVYGKTAVDAEHLARGTSHRGESLAVSIHGNTMYESADGPPKTTAPHPKAGMGGGGGGGGGGGQQQRPISSAVVSHQNGLYSIPTETGSNAEYAEPDAGIAQYGAPGGDALQYGQPGEYMERKVTLQGRQEQTNYAVPNRQATDDDDILPVPIKSGGTGTLNRSSLLVETVANASSGEYYASGVVATSEYQQLAEVVAEHGSVAYDMASGSPAYDTAA